jgi:hypothetical protein
MRLSCDKAQNLFVDLEQDKGFNRCENEGKPLGLKHELCPLNETSAQTKLVA